MGRALTQACTRRLKDPNGFLNAKWKFPGSMVGDSANDLTSLWNREILRALDTNTPKRSVLDEGGWKAPWFTETLQSMKH